MALKSRFVERIHSSQCKYRLRRSKVSNRSHHRRVHTTSPSISNYSYLRATMGSTRMARRTGRQHAGKADKISSKATAAKVGRSLGFTSNKNFASTLVIVSAPD